MKSARASCVVVVFLVAPLLVLTGLTMSPAVAAAVPLLLDLFGGHQSARTLHFAAFAVLMLFFVAHVVMLIRSGLGRQVRAMTLQEHDIPDRADRHRPSRRWRRSRLREERLGLVHGNLNANRRSR